METKTYRITFKDNSFILVSAETVDIVKNFIMFLNNGKAVAIISLQEIKSIMCANEKPAEIDTEF